MKITPIASTASTVGSIGGGTVEKRVMKMSTIATPESIPSTVAPQQTDQNLSNSDTNVDQAKQATEVTEPISPQAAAIAKQRRALQVKERAFADEIKALKAQLADKGDQVSLSRLKSEPLNVLLESGVTYDQLTEAILKNQNSSLPEIQALKDELKTLKEGFDKQLTDRDTQAEKQVLAEMRKEALRLTSEGETYEMVRETGSVPAVMELIERTYRKTGEVLDVSEALQLVETELVNDGLKLANLKKVQSKIVPPQPAPQPQQQQRQMRTLTNKDTANVPLTAKQRAIAAFHGTLKR